MNSLSYLSRQFDVLAAARTPPSTPAQEHAPILDGDNAAALKRVRTWSKPFLSDSAPSSSSGLKRSYSYPAEVRPTDAATSSTHATHTRRSSGSVLPPPPSRRPSVSTPETPIRPKSRPETVLHRILLVRVLLSLWHSLYDLWRSLADTLIPRTVHGAAAEEGSDDEEKDTEDEAKDEMPAGIVAQEPPPIPPPICPVPLAVSLRRANINTDDNLTLLEAMPAPATATAPWAEPPPPPSFMLTSGGETSRTSTPSFTKRTGAWHTQKTLVLDLDETLIHSTSRPLAQPGAGWLSAFSFGRRNKAAGHMIEVVLGGRSTLYHVYKRPFVDYFLRKVSCARRLSMCGAPEMTVRPP